MATLKCPISGIRYHCPHIPVVMEHPHPIFTLPPKTLDRLFCSYIQDKLAPTESYLLLVAYLKSTGAVDFRSPVTLDPTAKLTQKLIATNLVQLMEVTEKTNAIVHPSFSQPRYVVSETNSNLKNLPAYIEAWENNIKSFGESYRQEKLEQALGNIERKLQYLINSGDDRLTAMKLAEWADMCADFPIAKKEYYKKIIRSCFNQDKMFSIPLRDLEELRDECLAEIPAGSIYMHKLIEIISHGISLNRGFLGYTLLEDNSTELDIIVAKAPTDIPISTEFSSKAEYLKAKLSYNIAAKRMEDKEKANAAIKDKGL